MGYTMTINEWMRYRDLLRKLSKSAADEFGVAVFQKNGRWGGVGLGSIPREELIEYAYGLVTKYGEGSSAAACELYDELAALSNVNVPPAEPAATATINEVGKAINGILKRSQNEELLASTVGRFVKQAGQDTMLQNVKRDKAQFAWIPSGDTCSFCIMLASRGWQDSARAVMKNGHAEHIHANCDCAYAVRFSSDSGVAGYDPDKYLEMYDNAAGDTWQEKLNSMRRDAYADDREKITAQKRYAYAKRKEQKL